MTRGIIFGIFDDVILSTYEFNGDMYLGEYITIDERNQSLKRYNELEIFLEHPEFAWKNRHGVIDEFSEPGFNDRVYRRGRGDYALKLLKGVETQEEFKCIPYLFANKFYHTDIEKWKKEKWMNENWYKDLTSTYETSLKEAMCDGVIDLSIPIFKHDFIGYNYWYVKNLSSNYIKIMGKEKDEYHYLGQMDMQVYCENEKVDDTIWTSELYRYLEEDRKKEDGKCI